MKVLIFFAVITFVCSLISSDLYSYYKYTPEIEKYHIKRMISFVISLLLISFAIFLIFVAPFLVYQMLEKPLSFYGIGCMLNLVAYGIGTFLGDRMFLM